MLVKTTSPAAVIYTRVSSEEQVAGTSLGTQLDACRQCAARLCLSVLSEHEDAGKSARSTVGRDALAAAMDAAAKSKATLIVYKFDRLSRNLGDGYDLRDILIAKGCRIISASEGEASATPVSKAMYAMMMAFAELDNDVRAERCHAGMVSRAMAGAWVSNAPIGFRASRNAAGAPVLVPDGNKSEILRSAFLDFVGGAINKSGLVARLKREGWPDSTISRIIRSPVYGGIIRSSLTGGEDVPAAFPGLITADQWYILEARMRHGKRVALKDNPAFPYTSTIFCAICGQPVRSGFAKSRGHSFGYYFCGKASHPKARREDVHAQIAGMLAQIGAMTEYLELLKRGDAAVEIDDPTRKEREKH
jgi:DNA invertase Pin-like site-specific DNA recombinase